MTSFKAQSIVEDYIFHTMLIHRYVDDVSHQESILQLPFQHNCMNWILGHIVTNRSHVLETIKVPHAWQEKVRGLYHMGTPPITTKSMSVKFKKLVEYLDESDDLIGSALEKMSDIQLKKKHSNYRGEKSRYEHITSFHWHEAFHIGQLEVLSGFIESKR